MTPFDTPGNLHGGPDADGVPLHDFSTNANACGPCPSVLAAVQQADASRYPDPAYTALRQQLATLHGVAAGRVLLAASASEFIQRLSAVTAMLRGPGANRSATVWLPRHHYGDCARAAAAWGLQRTDSAAQADLLWACEPSSPLGQPQPGLAQAMASIGATEFCAASSEATAPVVALDCAYAPLRLSGRPSLDDAARDQAWQLWSPNKALGLTGIRAAYAIAPVGHDAASRGEVARFTAALQARCPSWPVGAHGVAMLQAWCAPEALAWLHTSLDTLRDWKARQQALLGALGWVCLPSEANFFCARPDVADVPQALQTLRAQGIKLRDADAFGLPGHVRVGVLPPQAQDALVQAWSAVKASTLLADTLRHLGCRPPPTFQASAPWPPTAPGADFSMEISDAS